MENQELDILKTIRSDLINLERHMDKELLKIYSMLQSYIKLNKIQEEKQQNKELLESAEK